MTTELQAAAVEIERIEIFNCHALQALKFSIDICDSSKRAVELAQWTAQNATRKDD